MPGVLDVFGDFLAEDILGLLVIVCECLRFALQDAIGSNMLGIFCVFGDVQEDDFSSKAIRWRCPSGPQGHKKTTQVKTTAICNMTVQFTMFLLQGFNVYQSIYVYIYIYTYQT